MNEVVEMHRPNQIHHVRLPKSIRPTLYTLELKPNLYTSSPDDFTFDGKLEIQIYVLEKTTNITLHAKELQIHYESLSLKAVVGHAPDIMSYNQEGQFAIFMLDDWLEMNKTYMFNVSFTGRLTNDLRGLFSSQYVENNITK